LSAPAQTTVNNGNVERLAAQRAFGCSTIGESRDGINQIRQNNIYKKT
jgi:hypothetical protein